jgi:hypothetical protein
MNPSPMLCSMTLALLLLATIALPLSHAVRKTRLTWVNGIAHNLDHMETGQIFISQRFGGKPVLYCHNPTAMSSDEDYLGYIGDLTQAGTQKLGRITDEVNALVKHLKDAVSAVGPRGVVVHIAHSQGALVTHLACAQLTVREMSQMEIVGFGGAAALRKTSTTPFRRCINYYSVNDPLLLLVPSAAQALRSGFSDEEFCFLLPRIGDPIRDHNLLGETYATALEWEGKRFQREYTPWVVRDVAKPLSAVGITLLAKIMVALRPLWMILRAISDKYGELVALYILRPLLMILQAIILLWQELFSLWRGKETFIPVQEAIAVYQGK